MRGRLRRKQMQERSCTAGFASRRRPGMHTLYTMGYSSWAPAQLAATVRDLGAALWDIRFSPLSRRPEWQGRALRAAVGPAYVHVKALGNKNYRGGPIELLSP